MTGQFFVQYYTARRRLFCRLNVTVRVGLLKMALVNILCCNSFLEVVSANFDQVQTVNVNAVLSPPVLALPV